MSDSRAKERNSMCAGDILKENGHRKKSRLQTGNKDTEMTLRADRLAYVKMQKQESTDFKKYE